MYVHASHRFPPPANRRGPPDVETIAVDTTVQTGGVSYNIIPWYIQGGLRRGSEYVRNG